jgi:DNA-binding MarR family transcriptional regulator
MLAAEPRLGDKRGFARAAPIRRWTVAFPENSPDPLGEFPIDAPQYLFYLIFQIDHHRAVAFEPVLEPFGLTVATWRGLSVVRRLDGCTMKSLAAFTAIDRTTLTRAVDQLVARGLIARTTPPNDRRKVSLSLTDAGEALYAQVVPALIAFNADNLGGLSDAKQREVSRALRTILEAIVRDNEDAETLVNFGQTPPPREKR